MQTTISKTSVSKTKYTDDAIIPSIAILLIVFFLVVFFAISFRDFVGQTQNSQCPAQNCATNIISGVRRCPTDNTVIAFDSQEEVCNDVQGCTNPETRCVYTDPSRGTSCPGDPNYSGLCGSSAGSTGPNGVSTCKCLSRMYCPDFATVYFKQVIVPDSGTITSGTTGAADPGFTAFVQQTVWTDSTNRPRSDLPLSTGIFGTDTDTTCSISESNLPRAFPLTGCIVGRYAIDSTSGNVFCMNVPQTLNCPSSLPKRNANGTFACS